MAGDPTAEEFPPLCRVAGHGVRCGASCGRPRRFTIVMAWRSACPRMRWSASASGRRARMLGVWWRDRRVRPCGRHGHVDTGPVSSAPDCAVVSHAALLQACGWALVLPGEALRQRREEHPQHPSAVRWSPNLPQRRGRGRQDSNVDLTLFSSSSLRSIARTQADTSVTRQRGFALIPRGCKLPAPRPFPPVNQQNASVH